MSTKNEALSPLLALLRELGVPITDPEYNKKEGWIAQREDEGTKLFLGKSYEQALEYLRELVDEFKKASSSEIKSVQNDIDRITLNEEQQQALYNIIDDILQGPTIRVLKGFAGTGKTTLMQKLPTELAKRALELQGGSEEDDLLKFTSEKKILFTAPTHQAVRVLERKLPDYTCRTIHSALRLVLKKKQGETFLVQEGLPVFNKYDVVVIDECSMNDEELNSYILQAFNSCRKTSVIFVGDPKQLPPINETISRSFEAGRAETLKRIVRQAENNPLLHNSKILRRMPSFDASLMHFNDIYEEDHGLFKLNASEWRKRLFNFFEKESFEKYPEKVRCLAWTNRAVGEINDLIHEKFYPDAETPYCVGERILAKEPINDGIIKTNEECVITEIEDSVQLGFPCWKLTLDTEYSMGTICYILKKEVQRDFNNQKNEYIADKNWRSFYELIESFANVQHCYAMTVHRSQGSTFDNVFVNGGDILKGNDDALVLQLLYVAITRPRFSAFLKL